MIVLITWILFFIEGAICYLFIPEHFIAKNTNELSFVIIFINALFVFFANFLIHLTNYEKIICNIGFLILVILICFDRMYSPLDMTDPEAFHMVATGQYCGLPYNYGGLYTKIISFIYSIFGVQRMVAQYVNALCFFSSTFFLGKIFSILQINAITRNYAFTIIATSPFFLFYNAILRRESIIVFFIVSSLFYFITWLKNNNVLYFVKAIFLSIIPLLFHSGTIAVFGGYIIFFILYDRNSKKFVLKWYSTVLVLIIAVFLGGISKYYGHIFLGKFQNSDLTTQTELLSRGAGGSGYTVPTMSVGNEIIYLVANTPLRSIYYLFSPMPWNWRGGSDLVAFFMNSFLYGLGIFVSVKYLKSMQNHDEKKSVVFLCVLILILSSIIFGWGVQNAGTAIRHRDKFIYVNVILLAIYFDKNKKICNKR